MSIFLRISVYKATEWRTTFRRKIIKKKLSFFFWFCIFTIHVCVHESITRVWCSFCWYLKLLFYLLFRWAKIRMVSIDLPIVIQKVIYANFRCSEKRIAVPEKWNFMYQEIEISQRLFCFALLFFILFASAATVADVQYFMIAWHFLHYLYDIHVYCLLTHTLFFST